MKSLADMNLKEVFEFSKAHLLSQNKRSMEGIRQGCLYHSPDGLKCAVGCFIPDNVDTSALEGSAINNPKLIRYFKIGSQEKKIELLIDLQRIHDSVPVSRWDYELNRLAANRGF